MVKIVWVYGALDKADTVKAIVKNHDGAYVSYTPTYAMGFELKVRVAEDKELFLLVSELEDQSCWVSFKRQTGFPPARPPKGTFKVGSLQLAADAAVKLTATSEVYQWVILIAQDQNALIGDSVNQIIPLGKDQSTGITNTDLSDVYAKNAGAGLNTKIVWYGVVND